MPSGLLGTRGSQPGQILLGWLPGGDDYVLAVGAPALYYRFEENVSSNVAADLTGARPGVYQGGTTLGELGPSYGAVAFDVGGYLNSSTSPLNITKGSISFWCKLGSVPTSTQLLFGFVDFNGVVDKTFAVDTSGNLTFSINDGSPHNLTTSVFVPTKWNHFVATFDGTTAKLYVNGVLATSSPVATSVVSFTSNNNVYIGSGAGSAAASGFPGVTASLFDEVVVWDSVILADYQVLGLYNIGRNYLNQAQAYITSQSLEVVAGHNPTGQITAQSLDVAYVKNPTGFITNLVIEVVRQVTVNDRTPVITELTMTSSASATQSFSSRVQKTVALTWTTGLSASQNTVIVSPRQFTLSSNLNVRQFISTVKNITVTLTVTNSLTASQSLILRNQVVSVTMTSNLSASQRIMIERTLTWQSNVSASQSFHNVKTTSQTLTDHLTLVELYENQKFVTRTLNDPLTLIETYSTAGSTHHAAFSDFQILTNSVPGSGNFGATAGFTGVLIVKDLSTHQPVTGITVINGLYTTILGQDGLITLPAAEYGDTLGAKVANNVLRSMTGKTYTYVKTNANDKFSMSFVLGFQKAYELKMFCKANFNNTVYLQLWDGRQFTARIISENIPLTFEGRWQGPEREKTNVTIDFEGFRTL